jgi:hypothetical protein
MEGEKETPSKLNIGRESGHSILAGNQMCWLEI